MHKKILKVIPVIVLQLFSLNVLKAQVSYQPENEKKFDLLHTELHLSPDWSKSQMKGRAVLTLKPHFYDQQSLSLDARGFDIQKVSFGGKSLVYDYDKEKLVIRLEKRFTRKDTLNLEINYVARPNEITIKGSNSILQDKGLYFINPGENTRQFWTQGETQANSCWFPTIDSPNEKHTQDIYLTVDKSLVTLSNGLLKSSRENADGTRTDHWQQLKPHAVYLSMIAAGSYKKVVDSTYKDFEVSYYVEPGYEKDAYGIFGRTPEMIRFFEKITGVKYPWDKYAQIPVREYVSGAMENTTATVHGLGVQKNANQLLDANDDGVIAHELFHHWFGDLVTCESWSNLPLNESFADYSEYLWAEYKSGKDEADLIQRNALEQYLFESSEKQVPLIRYYYHDREDMFDAHSYQKGGRVLHLLRKELGDEAFFAGLQLYLKNNAWKNTEISHLRMALEEVSGRDLNWFFDQWFLSPGHPRLKVNHGFKDGNLTINIQQTVDSVNSRIYKVPLTFDYFTGGKKTRETFVVSEASHEIRLKLPKAPELVSFDPEGYFLGVIEHEKSENELIRQFELSEDISARLNALEKLAYVASEEDSLPDSPLKNKKIRDIVLKAVRDPFWRIRQTAIQKLFDYDGEDFLEVERALQFVIKNETKTIVKADAIMAMKNFLNPQNDLLFRSALQDSSYMVRAAALEALLVNKPSDAEELVSKFRHIQDVNIFAAIGNYYGTVPRPEMYDWFVSNYNRMEGGEIYQTMGLFGTYLIQSDEETQKKSIPYLKKMAIDKPEWYVRFAATQVLYLLTEIPEGKKAMEDVIAKEQDKRLKEYYKQLRLE